MKGFFQGPEHRCRTLAQGLRYRQLVDPLIARASVGLERVAVAHGLEFRHPWLDVGLFEFVLAVPQDQLVQDRYYKYVVRNAFEGLMPERVRLRQRMAVPYPLLRGHCRRRKWAAESGGLLEDSLREARLFTEAAALDHFEPISLRLDRVGAPVVVHNHAGGPVDQKPCRIDKRSWHSKGARTMPERSHRPEISGTSRSKKKEEVHCSHPDCVGQPEAN